MIKVSLKGDEREFESGSVLTDIAKSISEGLARGSFCALPDGGGEPVADAPKKKRLFRRDK